MASVSTYLNFARNTEEAFNFINPFLAGNFLAMASCGSVTFLSAPDSPPIAEEDKNLVMHVELRILNTHSFNGYRCSGIDGF